MVRPRSSAVKQGTVREDGLVFWSRKKTGKEWWVSKEHFEKMRQKARESCRRHLKNNPEKIKDRNKRYYANNREREINRVKAQYRAAPEKFREKDLLRRFGLTLAQYNEILDSQKGVCAICENLCSSGKNLAVDHCHKTGKVRGLLCVDCNLGIANLKESSQIMQRASDYVERHKNSTDF